jgi:uncharacterized repeat protein (TIGR03803 family)
MKARRRQFFSRSNIQSALALFMGLILAGAASASTTQVIYSFGGGHDGEYADTELVVDSAGNLYGTTVQGGKHASGTVFQLSPSGSGWVHTVLYNFTGGTDGGEPYKGVTIDAAGNLYGTAVTGGGGFCEGGCGVTYKLTKSGGQWTQTVIHAFTGGDDGSGPGSPVVLDKAGNVYGTTPTGGADGLGTVYQLHPANGQWTFRVIHTFTGGVDGSTGSAGRVAFDGAGNLYGVATAGGAHQAGVAYKLTPTPTGEWGQQTLFAFTDEPDSGFPYGGLVADKQHNLYGTTYYAGAHDVGTVYRLSLRNGTWMESGLYSFRGGSDGSSPISTLVFDKGGNLYGTASEGGAACSCGTVFELSAAGGGATYSTTHTFQGMPDGAFPYDGMVMDSAGTLYGATTHGGTNNNGAIYQLIP